MLCAVELAIMFFKGLGLATTRAGITRAVPVPIALRHFRGKFYFILPSRATEVRSWIWDIHTAVTLPLFLLLVILYSHDDLLR